MSSENIQYIYETEEHFEESTQDESYAGPVLMGREREYFQRCRQAINDFVTIQQKADLQAELNKKVDTSRQLFGISNQNQNARVSLDEKFPGDILYKVTVDNMAPLIPKNSTVMLKFCDQHASGEVCVYRYKGQTYCNEIKLINNKIIAFSINPKYKPVVLDPEHYFFIAVVSSLHRTIKLS